MRSECRGRHESRASGPRELGLWGWWAAARAAASDGHFEPAASLTPAGWLARRVAWSGSKTWSHGTRSTCTGAGGGVQTGRRQRGCKGVCRMHGRAWAASDPELPKQRQRRALLHLVAVHLALVLEREPGWPHASKADRKAGVSRCGTRAAAALEPAVILAPAASAAACFPWPLRTEWEWQQPGKPSVWPSRPNAG